MVRQTSHWDWPGGAAQHQSPREGGVMGPVWAAGAGGSFFTNNHAMVGGGGRTFIRRGTESWVCAA